MRASPSMSSESPRRALEPARAPATASTRKSPALIASTAQSTLRCLEASARAVSSQQSSLGLQASRGCMAVEYRAEFEPRRREEDAGQEERDAFARDRRADRGAR